MTRKGFLFMTSYYDSIKELDEKNQLALFHAICQYGCEGTEVELEGLAKIIFGLIKPTLSASIKRYDNCVENGKRGGRPVANNQQSNPAETNNETNNETNPVTNNETQTEATPEATTNLNKEKEMAKEKGRDMAKEREKEIFGETSSPVIPESSSTKESSSNETTANNSPQAQPEKKLSRKDQLVNYVQGLQCTEAVKQELFNWIFGIGLDRGVTVKQLTSKVNDIWTDCDNDESLVQQAVHNAYKNGWFGFFRPNTASPKTTEKHDPSSFTNIPQDNNIAEDPEYQAQLENLRACGWSF